MSEELKHSWALLISVMLFSLLVWWNGIRNFNNGKEVGRFEGTIGYHNYVIRQMHETDRDSVTSDDLFEIFKELVKEHE